MSADFLSALLAANIAASAAILIVVLVRKPVRGVIGARLAHWLWAIPAFAGLATLLPARDAGTVPAPAAPIQPLAEATVSFATGWATPQIAAPAQGGFDLATLLAAVWAIGALAFLGLRLLQQHLALRALNLEAGEGARRSASNFGPAVVGVFRPLLVTPADFEQRYSRSEQALVLAHEDEHLRAGHTRVNAVALLVTSLCWFNPLIHWAAKLARDDQELACDAAVLQRFPKARGVYAEALLKTQVSSQALPLGCTWPSRSSSFFMERMTMLANKTPTRARRIAGIAAIATALLGTGLAAWAQKSPLPAFAGAVVSVDKDGHVLWDGKAADGKEALAAVAKVQGKSGSPHIRLTVDAATNYKTVVPVVEEAQKGGMKDITFLPSGTVFTTPTPPPPGLAPPKDPPAPIRVFVDFDGGVYWNGVWVNNAALDQNLKTAAAQAIQPELHIEPHFQSKFVRVVEVLDAAKKAGLTKTALVGGGVPFVAGMVK